MGAPACVKQGEAEAVKKAFLTPSSFRKKGRSGRKITAVGRKVQKIQSLGYALVESEVEALEITV